MSHMSHKYITVFIPVYNGERYLGECINAVLSQELPEGYNLDFIVIDSGSSDNSVQIAQQYGDKIRFSQIPNSEFGHGKTRNKATRMAKGNYILFITQDATPTHKRWLINMIEPFLISDKVGCVFGRQIPRPFAVPTIKREVSGVFGNLGAADSIILHRNNSMVDGKPTNPLNSFFSDANSAVRVDLLTGDIPFRDIPYSEDQALAEDMQIKGYLKAYTPGGSVWHSNEYTAKQYYHRKFDEYTGLQDSVGLNMKPSKKSLLLGWIVPTMHDVKFTLKDHDYTIKAKIKFMMFSPAYNFAEKAGRYNSLKYYNDHEF
ncbi:glycosyltransferase family 2 protein, partial [Candidatus Saccharibacteria bacterium]|nr:glycosyltransferase family 2 protein [Candidatus Saccharibacteria bacterium]